MPRRKRRTAGQLDADTAAQRPPPAVGTGLGPLLKAALRPTSEGEKGPPKREPDRSVPPTQRPPGPEPLVPVSIPPAPAPPKPRPDEGDAATSELPATELRWLNDAYAGATPLGQGRGRVTSSPPAGPARTGPPTSEVPSETSQDAAARARLAALVGEGVRFVTDQREDGWVQARRDGVGTGALRRLRGVGFRADATLDLHGWRRDEVAPEVARFVRGQHRRGGRYLLIVHGKGLHSEGGQGVLGDAVFEALTRGGAAPLVRAMVTPHEQHGGRGALAIFLG